jgi:hypothetical protein
MSSKNPSLEALLSISPSYRQQINRDLELWSRLRQLITQWERTQQVGSLTFSSYRRCLLRGFELEKLPSSSPLPIEELLFDEEREEEARSGLGVLGRFNGIKERLLIKNLQRIETLRSSMETNLTSFHSLQNKFLALHRKIEKEFQLFLNNNNNKKPVMISSSYSIGFETVFPSPLEILESLSRASDMFLIEAQNKHTLFIELESIIKKGNSKCPSSVTHTPFITNSERREGEEEGESETERRTSKVLQLWGSEDNIDQEFLRALFSKLQMTHEFFNPPEEEHASLKQILSS